MVFQDLKSITDFSLNGFIQNFNFPLWFVRFLLTGLQTSRVPPHNTGTGSLTRIWCSAIVHSILDTKVTNQKLRIAQVFGIFVGCQGARVASFWNTVNTQWANVQIITISSPNTSFLMVHWMYRWSMVSSTYSLLICILREWPKELMI